jgi:hypothetical protein
MANQSRRETPVPFDVVAKARVMFLRPAAKHRAMTASRW